MHYFELIRTDLQRFGTKPTLKNILRNLLFNRSFKYTFWMRLANSTNTFLRIIGKIVHHYYSNKYQIQIPAKTSIGPGLYLGHATTIVVSSSTTIGMNCNLSHFVNIGSNHGKAETIGDNVYIGPGVCIVECVTIGNNVTIGAGSIVVKNIDANATAVGNPARVANYNSPAQYIMNPVQ